MAAGSRPPAPHCDDAPDRVGTWASAVEEARQFTLQRGKLHHQCRSRTKIQNLILGTRLVRGGPEARNMGKNKKKETGAKENVTPKHEYTKPDHHTHDATFLRPSYSADPAAMRSLTCMMTGASMRTCEKAERTGNVERTDVRGWGVCRRRRRRRWRVQATRVSPSLSVRAVCKRYGDA